MTSIDKHRWRLLQSKAKVFDEIAKIKPMANGEIIRSGNKLGDWYEHDPEAFFGAMIAAVEALENANNRQLAGMRQRYRNQKRRRSPGARKNRAKHNQRSDRDAEASVRESGESGSAPSQEGNGDDEYF